MSGENTVMRSVGSEENGAGIIMSTTPYQSENRRANRGYVPRLKQLSLLVIRRNSLCIQKFYKTLRVHIETVQDSLGEIIRAKLK